jgi:hypothetical protein
MLDYDPSGDEDDDPAVAAREYAQLWRRFRDVAIAWLVGAALLWAVGGLDLTFAIVLAVAGCASALAVARYWRQRERAELSRLHRS